MDKNDIKKPDSRFDLHQIKTSTCELRSKDAGEASRTVGGYAVKWGEMSELLWSDYYEIIERGAITQEVIDKSDVVFVWNHERWTLPLGRKRPNQTLEQATLRLEIDEKGLCYTCEVPVTQRGDELIEAVRRGDVSGVSLAFIPDYDTMKWEDLGEYWLRRVTHITELFDISPTSYPCYDSATISNRSMVMLNEKRQSKIDERSKVKIDSERRKRDFEIFELMNS